MRISLGVSGGIDSTIAYYWGLSQGFDVTPVFVNMGQPYAKKERESLVKTGIPFSEILINAFDLVETEINPENYIIPGRNTLISSILAMSLPDEAWIVGMKHENHIENIDKNEAFYRSATSTFSLSYGKTILVRSPFIEMAKEDVIGWAIQNSLGSVLTNTVSCYHPSLGQCGECAACIKRFVALFESGIDSVLNYRTHPMKSLLAKNLANTYSQCVETGDFSRHHKDRIDRFFYVLGKA